MSQKTKEARAAYNRKYRQLNADKIRSQHSSYRTANLDAMKARDAAYGKAAKIDVLMQYGGIKCALCPENRLGALTIDHIDGNGGAHRASTNCSSGKKFYLWLKRNNFPTGYRVLCSNCNWRTHRTTSTVNESTSKYALRQKRIKAAKKFEIMTLLGGKCVKCKTNDLVVLTIHHQNNDGANHRRQLTGGASGIAFYYAILKTKDINGLECRCFSCNDAEEWG